MQRCTRKPALRTIDPTIAALICDVGDRRVSDRERFHALGISYNTWRKIKEGGAIRVSVADRLEAKVRPSIS